MEGKDFKRIVTLCAGIITLVISVAALVAVVMSTRKNKAEE